MADAQARSEAAEEREQAGVKKLIELDFGDADFVVRQFPDGMFTIETMDARLLLNEEQFKQVIGEADRIGKEKGWL